MGMGDSEGKLFTLKEAERTRVEVEPVLLEAMQAHRKMTELEQGLSSLAERIMRSGGMLVAQERARNLRAEHTALGEAVREALERIQATGCVVKDLDVGLLDFPARINDEEVYLCWRVGEDRIRFYHRQDEGFAGRRPLDPRDSGYQNPIQ
jgi:hypothetical protein